MSYGKMLASILDFYIVGFVIYVTWQVATAPGMSWLQVVLAALLGIVALFVLTWFVWCCCVPGARGERPDRFEGIDQSLRR